MKELTCKKGCCILKINDYITNKHYIGKQNKEKAGVFLYDPIETKVLLVQSRGNFWGPPKGTIKYGETDTECSIRETKEETGLDINPANFTNITNIRNRATCFYLEKNVCEVYIQDSNKDNDANGIGWIKPECLSEHISSGKMVINQYCRVVFKNFMNINFPESTFKKKE